MISVSTKPLLDSNLPSNVEQLITNDLKNYIIIKDGHVIARNTDPQFDAVGFYFTDDFNQEVYEQHSILSDYTDEMYQYNFEEANSVFVLEIPKNYVNKEVLHVFYIQEQEELVQNTLIIAAENSDFRYFEHITNMSESHISFVSNTIVKENARVEYTGLSKLSSKAVLSAVRNGYVYRYGSLSMNVAEVNDSLTQSNTNIFLLEKYANGTTKTVAITSLEQEAKFKQLVEHLAPETEGYIENYGVSNNNSILVFEGIGKINKDMKQSVARQSNKGIVLGKKSRLDANPLLLIDEFDVVASHGAAIGKMDEEQLYYLMSRGLTLNNAQRLIISGFLSPVLSLLTTDQLKEEFILAVENKTL